MTDGVRVGWAKALAKAAWLNGAIRALVVAGFCAVVVANFLPFFDGPSSLDASAGLGLGALIAGFLVLPGQPSTWTALYFASFGLSLIAALVGLALQRRHGRMRLVVGLMAAAFGFVTLPVPYFFAPHAGWTYGYFTAEGGFLLATVGAAIRLMREWRLTAPGMGWWSGYEPAASASQQLLGRYRGER